MDISRRDMIRIGLAGTAPALAVATEERDAYGGWTKLRFEKTGYFRLEQDDRWWMVTPQGHAFLSFGVNHIHGSWWRAPYNGNHWARQFGVAGPRDPRFDERLRSWLMEVIPRLGFNSVGVHTDLALINTPRPFVPYVARFEPIDIPHWKSPGPSEFPDVFGESFRQHALRMAQSNVAPLRDDPMLIGYSMTDCPILTDWDAKERGDTVYGAPRTALPTFPKVLRNLPGGNAGKRAYVETIADLYKGSVSDFNAAYGTNFRSFDSLDAAADWRPATSPANAQEIRDNTAFLRKVVHRYYDVAREAIRRHDPNHLFLGDKLNGNTDAADTVVDITAQFTDLVFYQAYGRFDWLEPSLDRWAAAGKPLFNGDGSFATPGENMPRPYGPLAEDHDERAAWTLEYADRALSRPDFVGWSYCGLIDTWTGLSERKQLRQHAGVMSPTGVFHEPMRLAMRTIADRLYEIGGR